VPSLDFSPRVWKGGALQAAEKPHDAVILSPFAIVLSAVKNLALPLRVNYAKDLALFIFKAMRDSSFARLRTAAAPQNDSAFEFFRSLFSPAVRRPSGLFPSPARRGYRRW
jgi:hypothetical protein